MENFQIQIDWAQQESNKFKQEGAPVRQSYFLLLQCQSLTPNSNLFTKGITDSHSTRLADPTVQSDVRILTPSSTVISQSDSDECDSHLGAIPVFTASAYFATFPMCYVMVPDKTRDSQSECAIPTKKGRLLWDFLHLLLNDSKQRYAGYIEWKNRDASVFKVVNPTDLARLWGIQKNIATMSYERMSRTLRYYYELNVLRRVDGERHCYQFLNGSKKLKNKKCKNKSARPQRRNETPKAAPVLVGTKNFNNNRRMYSKGFTRNQSSHTPSPYVKENEI